VKKILLFIILSILCATEYTYGETTIDRLVKKIVTARDSNDVKIYKIEKWVRKNIKYYSDKKQFNMNERWTLPMETLQRRKGDCEDGAILIMSLATTAGIPRNRLRLYAPIVVSGGYHASVAYRRESDNEWVWVEWTTRAEKSFGPINRRVTTKESRIFLPLGDYLEVTTLNPFNMNWFLDDDWRERAREILGTK
jgi:predicted transglutaminase-like cysteine proteinase